MSAPGDIGEYTRIARTLKESKTNPEVTVHVSFD